MNLSESELPLGLENPFFHRGPIHSPRYFFGRIEETRRALRMLRSGQCVSAVGPRHIGKTSFLSHMLDPDVQKGHYIGEEFLFVYTDCQSLGDPDKLQFYQRLWKETQLMFADRGIAGEQVEEPSGFCEFRDAVLSIRSQEKEYKLVFLLDEFEAVAQNPNLDQSFFSDLRSLASTVAYVTASQDSLFELAYADKSVLSSPFFMVFEQCHLGFLTPEEASGMVSELLKGVGHERLFTEEDLTFIFEIAGYHPYFLQVACYYLFERKREYVELTPEDYSIVRRQYADQVEPFFRYAWERSEGDEQESMQLVNKGKASHLSPEQRRRLERKCILYEGDFFSSAFAELAWKQVNRAQTWKTYLAGMGQIASWFKKALVALVTILFVFSAVLAGPDLPDLALGALGFENVTTMNIHSTGGEILVKVYSPKLLLVGRTAHIRMQVYNSEKPEFGVVADHHSSDVVITEEKDFFEIECKGTDASILSRSTPIRLRVTAAVPTDTDDTLITIKTNHFLSLLAHVSVLLASGGFSVKKLCEWLRAAGRRKQTAHNSNNIRNQDSLQ